MNKKNGWGGKRAGAGRPKGSTKDSSVQRKPHQIRAFDDEWEIIRAFSQLVKYGHKDACKAFVATLNQAKEHEK